MLSNFLIVVGQVATLFLLMGVGYILAKQGHLNAESQSQMSHLLLYIVCPCIVIDSMLKAEYSAALLRSLMVCAAALIGTYALNMLIIHPFYARRPPDQRDTLRFASIYGNCGFMGLPLAQGVLGDSALIFCTVVLCVFNISIWTHGAALMGGRENVSLKRAVLNPGVIGCLIGLAFFLTGLRPPEPLAQAVDYIADLNTPMAMVIIGGQMASANLSETFRKRTLYFAALLKLVLIPAITAALLFPLHLEQNMYCVIVLLAGCPTAGTTSMFAQRFQRDTATAAQSVTLSTLLSIVTLPILAVIAQALAGPG